MTTHTKKPKHEAEDEFERLLAIVARHDAFLKDHAPTIHEHEDRLEPEKKKAHHCIVCGGEFLAPICPTDGSKLA